MGAVFDKSTPAFAGSPSGAYTQPSELDYMAAWMRRKLVSGQHLFHQGDDHTHIYVVKSGFIRLYSLLDNGRCQVIGYKSPNEIVAFEHTAKHRFSAQAVTAAELRCLPTSTLYSVASSEPQILRWLYHAACAEISRAYALVLTIAKRDAESSVAAFIIEVDSRLAANSGSDFSTLPMLRGDIANYLGLTNETVSRVFSAFKKRRMIEVRGRHGIRLIDRAGLRAIAERVSNDRMADLFGDASVVPRRLP